MAGLIPFLMQTMAYRRALEERQMEKAQNKAEREEQAFVFPTLPDSLDDPTARAINQRNGFRPSPIAQQLFPNVFNGGQQ